MAGSRRRRKKKKAETSKILLIVSDTTAIVCAIAAIVHAFATKDSSPFAYLIPAVFGLAATSHGFYYWKAKAENLRKFGRGEEITENDDNYQY